MATSDRLRRYGCLLAAAVLVVVGTLATGFLPASLEYQALAGATIVAGFALVFVCLGGVDIRD